MSSSTKLPHLSPYPPTPSLKTSQNHINSFTSQKNSEKSSQHAMADQAQIQRPSSRPSFSLLGRIQQHAPHSPQLLGFLTIFISASILIFLIGLTITAALIALIFFAPFILLTTPIWLPFAFLLFLATAGLLSLGGFAVAVSWAYSYFKGMHPPGTDRLEYARSRIYDTASHVKDYAREYGGYLQSKVKDAAPGA